MMMVNPRSGSVGGTDGTADGKEGLVGGNEVLVDGKAAGVVLVPVALAVAVMVPCSAALGRSGRTGSAGRPPCIR